MMICDLQNLALEITKKHNLRPIEIKFKRIQRGHAYFKTRRITIPTWVLEGVKEYRIYYVVHELTHFIERKLIGFTRHDTLFKNIETKILKDYGIIPIYSRAYIKQLKNFQGQVLCGRLGGKK